MAVPTITSVSPSTIWTGGQVIVVVGSNFRLPTEPPASDQPLPAPLPTVRVLVDGVASTDVEVLSSTKLALFAPAHDPGVPNAAAVPPVTGRVGITVQNLDDAGAPIPGEVATLAEALLYARPDLSVEDDSARVERELILMLRRQLLENVVKTVAADYGQEPWEFTYLGETPALVLAGPRVVEDVLNKPAGVDVASGPSLVDEYRAPEVVTLAYALTGYTKSSSQNLALLMQVRKFFRRNAFVAMDRDKADPAAGQIRFRLMVPVETAFEDTSAPNKDHTHSFTGSFIVQNVVLEDVASFPGEAMRNKDVGLQTSEVVEAVAKRPS